MTHAHVLRDWNGTIISPHQMASVEGCSMYSADGMLLGDFNFKLADDDAEAARAAHVRAMLQAPVLLEVMQRLMGPIEGLAANLEAGRSARDVIARATGEPQS